MSAAERIGILGGTFDPIHCGHLDACAGAMEALRLDRVLLVPTHVPPHRPRGPHASTYHRFAMVALAALDREGLLACDLELLAPGPSYTSATLARLVDAGFRASQMFFITGADAFADIATWKDYPAILDSCHFVVVSRPGASVTTLPSRLPDLAARMRSAGNTYDPNDSTDRPDLERTRWIFLVDAVTADVSSTDVRRRLVEGASVLGLVPARVGAYITRHALYGSPTSADELQKHAREQT